MEGFAKFISKERVISTITSFDIAHFEFMTEDGQSVMVNWKDVEVFPQSPADHKGYLVLEVKLTGWDNIQAEANTIKPTLKTLAELTVSEVPAVGKVAGIEKEFILKELTIKHHKEEIMFAQEALQTLQDSYN